MPEVHGSRKGLDPHRKPENQPQPIVSSEIDRKPRVGQGKAGVRRKMKAPASSYTRPGTSESRQIVVKDEADPILPKPMSEIPRSEMLPPYSGTTSKAPSKNPR